jgi:hypothetical protein
MLYATRDAACPAMCSDVAVRRRGKRSRKSRHTTLHCFLMFPESFFHIPPGPVIERGEEDTVVLARVCSRSSISHHACGFWREEMSFVVRDDGTGRGRGGRQAVLPDGYESGEASADGPACGRRTSAVGVLDSETLFPSLACCVERVGELEGVDFVIATSFH